MQNFQPWNPIYLFLYNNYVTTACVNINPMSINSSLQNALSILLMPMVVHHKRVWILRFGHFIFNFFPQQPVFCSSPLAENIQWRSEIQTCPIFEWSTCPVFEWCPVFEQFGLAQTVLYIYFFILYKMVQAKLAILFFHSKTGHKNIRFFNVSGFQMVGFRIPTVI